MQRAQAILCVSLAALALVISGALAVTAAQTSLAPQDGQNSGPTYNVTFSETGLPSGTNWTVTVFHGWSDGWGGWSHGHRWLNGWHRSFQSETSNNSTITFALTNGTYGYWVSQVPGFGANASWGWFQVNGTAPPTINVTFSPLVTYSVTFSETGLPAATNWSVTVVGGGWELGWCHGFQSETSNTSSITFELANGTYRYRVSPVPGYEANASWGWFQVNGTSPPTIDVTFTPLVTYAVTFNESGLPAGTNWTVAVFGGQPGWGQWWDSAFQSETSNTSMISFNLTNGTYAYWIEPVQGWNVTDDEQFGQFNVTGASPPEISVEFAQSSWS